MPRFLFGGNAAVESNTGVPIGGAIGTAWTAKTGGAQLTDLQTEAGAAISTVTTESNGAVPVFRGPDGVSQLWLDFGFGRFLAEATDADEQLDTRVAAVELTAAAASSAAASASLAVAGKYTRPAAGIPSTDLASAVQTLLTKVGTHDTFLARFDQTAVPTDGQGYFLDPASDLLKPGDPGAAGGIDPAFLLRGIVLNEGQADPAGIPTGALRFRRPAAVLSTTPLGRLGASGVTTLTIPTEVDVEIGEYLDVYVACSQEGTVVTTVSAAVAGGPTLTQLVSQVQGNSSSTAQFSGRATARIPAGTAVTVTASAARSDLVAKTAKSTGLISVGALDQQAISGGGTTLAVSTGPTGSTAQANELATACVAWNNTNGLGFTAAAGWTALGSTAASTDTSPRSLAVFYKLLSTSGPVTFSGSLVRATGDTTTTSAHSSCLVTRRAA